MSDASRRNPSWRITKFGLPKSGSPTEIKEFKLKNGLAATKREYGYCLMKETPTVPDPLTTIGIGILWNLAIGGGDNNFGNSSARLGVSDNATAFNATNDTNLIATGGSYMFMQAIDLTYPTIVSPQVSWEATFSGLEANFGWQSFGVDNDAADGPGDNILASPTYNANLIASYNGTSIGLLNRLVENEMTKPSGQTWILTLIIQQS